MYVASKKRIIAKLEQPSIIELWLIGILAIGFWLIIPLCIGLYNMVLLISTLTQASAIIVATICSALALAIVLFPTCTRFLARILKYYDITT